MKYQWLFEGDVTCEQLGEDLGCHVLSVTRGNIIVGYGDSVDPDGSPTRIPITKRGIEIETEGQLGAVSLAVLDERMAVAGLRREHIKEAHDGAE